MAGLITYQIHEELGVFVSHWSGSITNTLMLDCYRNLFENPAWKPGLHELADLRSSEMSKVTPDGLRALIGMVEHRFEGLGIDFKTAIIASADLPYGLARLYEMVSEQSPESVQVFRSSSAAVEWLGVPESVLIDDAGAQQSA